MAHLRQRIVVITVALLAFTLYSNFLHSQCSFTVSATLQKNSDCQSNGIVKAVMVGEDVTNGNVELSDAKYGISAVGVGYTQAPVANGGLLVGVPPGTYVVTAQAFCKKSNTWITRTSNPVTVQGTYTVLDIDETIVVSASIKKSLKCAPTGEIPIKIEGGKAPYTVRISSAPVGYTGALVFTQPTAGTLTIPGLPAGSYVFDVNDACTYTIYGLTGTVGEIVPSFSIGTITHTPVCLSDGVIPIKLKDGTTPYTINVLSHPAGYSGSTTFTVPSDGTFNLSNLPVGTYTFDVSDLCHTQQLSATVNPIPLTANIGAIAKTLSCNSDGSIPIAVGGGLAPYTISITSKPACYAGALSFLQPVAGTHTLGGLCEGSYSITVSDACGTTRVIPNLVVDVVHLDASLVSTTNATSACTPTGSAIIRIQGGKPSYAVRLISTPPTGYVDPSPITITAPTNAYTIGSMITGSYQFEVEDTCGEKDTIAITIGLEPMSVTVGNGSGGAPIPSFGCEPTGGLVLTIVKGCPQFTVVMSSHTSTPPYTGPTTGFTPATTDGRIFNINDLPQGTYTFTVTDSCGTTQTVTGVVGVLLNNFPPNFYADYFFPPTTADPDCKAVNIKRSKSVTGVLGYYWNDHAKDYYEVVFMEDNDTRPISAWTWLPVLNEVDTVLSRTYCQMRTSNGYMLAHIRVKGDTAFSCGMATDTIRMRDVVTKVGTPSNPRCAGFDVTFKHEKDEKGFFCYPYSWELQRLPGYSVAMAATGITSSAQQSVTGIPFGDYVFKFTDAEGCSWYSDTLSYHWSPQPVVNLNISRNCTSYTATFTATLLCPPYSWSLLDESNVAIAGQPVVATAGIPIHTPSLQYNHSYTLQLLYNGARDTATVAIRQNDTLYYNYHIALEASYCLPDTAKGSIVIHRDASMPNFEQGSVLQFISGPTIPRHPHIIVTAANVQKLYPFSPDSLVKTYQPLLAGVYKFKLIDTCGVEHLLTATYALSTLTGFTYTKDESCAGLKIFPEGVIYLGTVAQPTYFRIRSAPVGVAVSSASVTAGGFLFLPESGQYVIQVSTQNATSSCPFDTLVIDYSKRSVQLDTDLTEAYVCHTGDVGYIKVVRKGGIGPFEYELFDAGVSQGHNSTGIFNYGAPGQVYTVRIKDAGCKVSFDQDIVMVNLSAERLLYGTTDYCLGDRIELNGVPINTNSYGWTGPNGFSSNLQNPRIDNASFPHEGAYVLSVQPEGCMSPLYQTMTVNLHHPNVPIADSLAIECLGTPAAALNAIASAGHTLQWYDTNATSVLSSAPVPATTAAGIKTYYVAQVNNQWGCISNKVPVKVTVSDLPTLPLEAQAHPICPNTYPVVVVPFTNTNYTYQLYTSPSGAQLLGSTVSTGGEVAIKSSATIPSTTTYYVEVQNHYGCRSIDRKAVTVAVENYLYIKPDALPEYKRKGIYNIQLESNAVGPYAYSSSYALPLGFTLSPDGLISGTPPPNGWVDPQHFSIKLEDANGCILLKNYVLKSGPFVPEVITPNGDGYNDVFMKGNHVIIFDRLGITIFEGNDGWDGTRKGQPAPADTYFYLLDFRNTNGTITSKKGYITVLRR